MKITVVQPRYHDKDEAIAAFLMKELEKVEDGELIVLPEYSNAGGLSDPAEELAAVPRAASMLEKASAIAKEKKAYIAINVLEEREGKLRNSTYLFDTQGEAAFVYDKIHLPPSEVALGIVPGDGACVCDLDGIRFGFMTCYDIYYNEQIEHLASQKPDIIILPSLQRGERVDILHAQLKLLSFRCNAFTARSSMSMESEEKGGCSMIVAPDGQILQDLGKTVGAVSAEVDPKEKYMRTAGFGCGMVRNDAFIDMGLKPEVFG
ncbi:MAG: carbon-nitrogen hydrolase family protein [Oscillospiraceae bacterium]|nr:carbon-nitrogen hydrolase family protein [Oscillospiraceae bacterium]